MTRDGCGAPPSTNEEAVALHAMPTDQLVTGAAELVTRYRQTPGTVAEILAELRRRDPQAWSYRAISERFGLPYKTAQRWVQLYTDQEPDQ